MRVLLDCRMAEWSGIGRYCKGLVRALAEEPDITIVQMVAAGAEPPVPSAEAVEAHHHPFSLRGALEFGRIARAVAPDLTHALHFPTPRPAARPLVVTLQDLTPLAVPGVMPSAVKRAVYRRSIDRAVRLADRILTPSQFSARDVVRFFPGAEGRITPVLLAADDFTGGPVGVLPEWLNGHRFVLSMGNTKPHKDLPTLLRAFAALPDTSLTLVLAGADPGGYAASVLGNDPAVERVRFTGRVSDDTLRALYASAELMAFPSLYEGFGLPPLEAMAFGTPVVVARAASVPEVVGDAAVMVDTGDADGFAAAMRSVLEDAAVAERLRVSGLARAAGFTWRRTAERTLAVYREAALA